ncbi:MAG: ABC transporter ATP-binding protein, partial [Candidatus Micrarchaeaceae archaeon]
PIRDIISGSSRSCVFVRAAKLSVLEKALRQQTISFEKDGEGLRIASNSTDIIGDIAFRAGVPILELARHSASLEEAFLELTEGAEEYKAGGEPQKEAKS